HPRLTLFPYPTLFRSFPGNTVVPIGGGHGVSGAVRQWLHRRIGTSLVAPVTSEPARLPTGRMCASTSCWLGSLVGDTTLVSNSADRKSTRLNSSHSQS